jgi:dGTP triphosphohydrolase
LVTNLVTKNTIRARREAAIKEAEAEGEMIKKEKILQAKEKFIQLKSDYDRQVNDRNAKLKEREQAIRQNENAIKDQQKDLDRKHTEANRLKEQLERQLSTLDRKKEEVERMMRDVYGQLLADVKADCRTSPIFTHHVAQVTKLWGKNAADYDKTEANQLVVDYIASMTDDYFIDLHDFLFPDSPHKIQYKGYFD